MRLHEIYITHYIDEQPYRFKVIRFGKKCLVMTTAGHMLNSPMNNVYEFYDRGGEKHRFTLGRTLFKEYCVIDQTGYMYSAQNTPMALMFLHYIALIIGGLFSGGVMFALDVWLCRSLMPSRVKLLIALVGCAVVSLFCLMMSIYMQSIFSMLY
ncbi:MAG: hypothetical protein PHX51_05735 [Clostridia bacterium]|nr:hypothetical protein [Clostridia bacterium]